MLPVNTSIRLLVSSNDVIYIYHLNSNISPNSFPYFIYFLRSSRYYYRKPGNFNNFSRGVVSSCTLNSSFLKSIVNSKSYSTSVILDSNYVSGLVNAEGCFNVNISGLTFDNSSNPKFKLVPTFSIGQQATNLKLIDPLVKIFNGGAVYVKSNGSAVFQIRGYKAANLLALPHFFQYSL